MLDAMASIGPRSACRSFLDCIQHQTDGSGRQCVGPGLQPGAVSPAEELGELVGIVVQKAVLVRLAGVAIREVGGSPNERAIRVELDAGESQPRITEWGHQPQLEDLVEQARDDHQVHTHAQSTPVTQAEVGLELSPAHLCVKHGRDPGSQDRVLGGLEVT